MLPIVHVPSVAGLILSMSLAVGSVARYDTVQLSPDACEELIIILAVSFDISDGTANMDLKVHILTYYVKLHNCEGLWMRKGLNQ